VAVLRDPRAILGWPYTPKQRVVAGFVTKGIEPAPEFVDEVVLHDGKPGVYSFWEIADDAKRILYVGTSVNLGSRVPGSYGERLAVIKRDPHKFSGATITHASMIPTASASDAALLEVFMICTHKPLMNGTSKHADTLTLTLADAPGFTRFVPVA
jgi:hypothetical protein